MPPQTRIRIARRLPGRDQLGHWSSPDDVRKPCMHRCCSGRRPHPQNLPVRIDRDYLRSLSDEQVYRELENYGEYSDTHEAGFLQVIAEANRREKRQESRERGKAKRARQESEYRDHVYRQWLQAESATNGVMLNKAGLSAGIDERSLFSGPQSRVNRYASDELKEFFLTHRRQTRDEFDRRQRAEEREARQAARRAA